MKNLKDDARIGIINRGECAFRFIRAVKEYNLSNNINLCSVAFYVDDERSAVFAKEAHDSFCLNNFKGFSNTSSPYLNHELLITALKESNCDAVWVGWGFVSEDAEFVARVEEAGLVFLGPSSHLINLVGDKISSKELAERSNTPICPWSKGSVKSLEEAYAVSEKIGYPVVVKASNAGGGRGIRFVFNKEEMPAQYESAREETIRVTGGDLMFIERLVEIGRHLEVQSLADRHGNIKTFGVRDCSVQRKNQKIIEETPPFGLGPETLDNIQKAAYGLLKEAKYESAGTVEFLFDIKRGEFYFMEVNSRLQVEHPITETLFDIDLIAGQIDVARGMSIENYNTKPNGHVMEVRLNAEDAENGFRPSPGFVELWRPAGGIGVRIDSGITEGSTIPSSFDSMVAKIIVKANNRNLAIARLNRAISETTVSIAGGTTNRTFLLELLNLDNIKNGAVHTRFVEEYLDNRPNNKTEVAKAFCVVAAEIYDKQSKDHFDRFNNEMMLVGQPRESINPKELNINLQYKGESIELIVRHLDHKRYCIYADSKYYYFDYLKDTKSKLIINDKAHKVLATKQGDNYRVEIDDVVYLIESDDGGVLKASSPGLVLKTAVKKGDVVKKGSLLLSLEAMKMEIPLVASSDGVVSEVFVKNGTQINAGDLLLKLEKNSANSKNTKSNAFDSITDSQLDFNIEYSALFTGQDNLSVKKIKDLYSSYYEKTLQFYLSYFIYVETFFKTTKEKADTLSYNDYFNIIYKADDLDKESFPIELTDILKTICKNYKLHSTKENYRYIMYKIFRSHLKQNNKIDVLTFAINQLNSVLIPSLESDLAKIPLLEPSLTTLCQEKLFELFDKQDFEKNEEERLTKLKHTIKLLKDDSRKEDNLIAKAISYGQITEPYLASQSINGDSLALKILSHRIYRLSNLSNYNYANKIATFTYKKHHGETANASVMAVSSVKEAMTLLKNLTTNMVRIDRVIIFTLEDISLEEIASVNPSVENITIGHVENDKINYKNFKTGDANVWHISTNRGNLSPLLYREMRVYRLHQFEKQFTYINNLATLIYGKASDNDERLFLCINIEHASIDFDDNGNIIRVAELEQALKKGLAELSKVNLSQKKLLHWNRLIINFHQATSIHQTLINNYVTTLVNQIKQTNLGLIQVSIYMQSAVGNANDEIVVSSLNGSSLSLVRRKPANNNILPLNLYDSKALRCLSRGLFYPYDVIKMLVNTYNATFEEYDLDENEKLVNVSNRKFGRNTANVVVGLLKNEINGMLIERVFIISDPSGDMGSLSKNECLRVNQALDLAESLNISVEWLPISSGAKIAMDSGTENLDWTASTLRRIIKFTQDGREINIIVSNTNVGAQSYWNSEATMLMHCKGLLIMTAEGTMLLTGKKALDFSGSTSANNNSLIGGAEAIMKRNGEAGIMVSNLTEAFDVLMKHYLTSYAKHGSKVAKLNSIDSDNRNVALTTYGDTNNSDFKTIGDIFDKAINGDKKKPFAIRNVMRAVLDTDSPILERYEQMNDAEGAVVWQGRMGGEAVGLVGIESQNYARQGFIPHNGPLSYNGGTLYPLSSKKIAKAINNFSNRLPLVVLANLSGFDGSPDSLLKTQLEWGAEIGRAIVNFTGKILFVVIGRYHGGAYVVFSKQLNPNLKTIAIEGCFASVIGGGPAAAVVFPNLVSKETIAEESVVKAGLSLANGLIDQSEYDKIYKETHITVAKRFAERFDKVHSVERAKEVGSIDEIIKIENLRETIINNLKK